jgi:hypothetical protein
MFYFSFYLYINFIGELYTISFFIKKLCVNFHKFVKIGRLLINKVVHHYIFFNIIYFS